MTFPSIQVDRGRMAVLETNKGAKGRVFTIELDSGDALRRVSVPNGAQRILLEGTIGPLRYVRFVEDTILELVGTGGILRVDLSTNDLARSSQKCLEVEEK